MKIWCKIRSGSGDKKTTGVDAEKKLEEIYGKKYCINLDYQILTDHSVFYPQALYSDLVFEVTLASADHVVKGSDPTKLKYKLTNIQLEYEMIRSEDLANQATSAYKSSKEFLYDHVSRFLFLLFEKNRWIINIKGDSQRRSINTIILFVEPYSSGARDSEKFIFPDLNKVSVMINGSPNMLYNNGIKSRDAWSQVSRLLYERKTQTPAYDSAEVLHQK